MRALWLPRGVSLWLCAAAFTALVRGAEQPPPLGDAQSHPTPEHPVTFRGDGSGQFPGAQPPLNWSDGTTGRWKEEPDPEQRGRTRRVYRYTRDPTQALNIRWRTLLPSYSNASPIVAGDKVFVTSDPVDYAPLLLCLDAGSGRILWQRELDHLQLVLCSPEEREAARRDWSSYNATRRRLFQLLAERRQLAAALKLAPEDPELLARLEAWRARAAAAKAGGMEVYQAIDAGGARGISAAALEIGFPRLKELADKFGCVIGPWEARLSSDRGKNEITINGGAYVGYSHPTPLSDGRFVYVQTGHNCAACYDLEGNCRWFTRLSPRAFPQKGRYPAGWMDFTQSPVLIGDVLLVGSQLLLTGLDARTGKTLWHYEPSPDGDIRLAGGYDNLLMTGARLEVGGRAWFLWYDGRVYRPSDGKAVTDRVMGRDVLYVSAGPIVCGDTVIYASSPARDRLELVAVKFQMQDGERLSYRTLWRQPLARNPFSGICWDNQVFVPIGGRPGDGPSPRGREGTQHVFDLATGKTIFQAAFTPDHLSGLLRAGEYLFTFESLRCGVCRTHVWDRYGKPLGENLLSSAPPDEKRLQWMRGETGRDAWNDGFYHGNFHAAPFFHGNRLYIRSRDELLCVGAP